jgi:hypothetical protein
MVKLAEALRPAEPVTSIMNVNEPAVLGDPAIVPDTFKLNPLGRLPESSDHLGEPGPVAFRV